MAKKKEVWYDFGGAVGIARLGPLLSGASAPLSAHTKASIIPDFHYNAFHIFPPYYKVNERNESIRGQMSQSGP
jgi:hypothetical protein